ncbi:sigma-54 dependent transcriptional regulator [Luteimonas sp. RIT-PG2_3]
MAPLDGELAMAGWRIHHFHTVAEVSAWLAHEPGLFTGLLDLVSTDAHAPHATSPTQALGELLGSRRIAWVAGIRPEQLESEWMRSLVHDYCHDYVTFPCGSVLLGNVLGHALGMLSLSPAAASQTGEGLPIEGVVGQSPAMRLLGNRLCKAASCDAPVFLSGETGTGKELAAAAIHRRSTRSAMPFVAINCGAIPHSLMQSELFGYERGAFTGAVQRKLGRVELAHRGTLFLDEIADLPMDSQASLLRFLEQGTIERLGGQTPIPVDARIISATHVELKQAVAEGRFRVDLYHRLRVIELHLPALRERGGDIVLIARHALERHAREGRFRFKGFSPCALRALHQYDWPGNVRELINRVREAMIMADSHYITAQDLRLDEQLPTETRTLDLARREGEIAAIEHALLRNNHQLAATAEELGISRVTLYRLMLRHGLHNGKPVPSARHLSLVRGGEPAD